MRKPNPLLFETAAARLRVPPRGIWFIGDRLDMDVRGAREAAMTAVWFNPDGASDPAASADLTVTEWRELVRHALRARPHRPQSRETHEGA